MSPKLGPGMRIYAKYGVVSSDCPATMFVNGFIALPDVGVLRLCELADACCSHMCL